MFSAFKLEKFFKPRHFDNKTLLVLFRETTCFKPFLPQMTSETDRNINELIPTTYLI